jgi:hypothetical protein
MFCPNCSSTAVQGQRYCRTCGANLGAIWDAMEGREGRRSQIDFETLKADLRELGANLRAGFERAKEDFNKHTKRFDQQKGQPPAIGQPQIPLTLQNVPPEAVRDLRKTMRDLRRMANKVKAANTRKYSLQQASASIFSGGALLVAWYYLLQRAGSSGLLNSLEAILLQKTGWQIEGLVPVVQMFWLFALIPVATGIAHLINGIFFAPKQAELEDELEDETPVYQTPLYGYQPQPYSMPPVAATPSTVSTNELERDTGSLNAAQPVRAGASITEDATLRFESKEKQ